MTDVTVTISGILPLAGGTSVVILGLILSGKTQLARQLDSDNNISAISAQCRTWLADNLPVQEKSSLRSNVLLQMQQWRRQAWRPVPGRTEARQGMGAAQIDRNDLAERR